ncbi:MAG: isoleucyl-tRNA synthetase [Acidobacteriota bacterium]|nr:isoleucyl-tRNA synthetase [Acidobacteriota bacterium]
MSTETPLELKKTINLPKTAFAQKANLAQAEPARLERWTQTDLYGMIREASKGREKFILHDGPPYANADIHLGTALNKIIKDFVVRSRTMMGYDAPYVPGYDCHGLPIELYVDKKLGAKKANMDAVTIRKICREHASEALKSQTRDFKRLGILGLWERPYSTMSNGYEAETARLFAHFVERGYVYKGARPVYWCVYDQTALAEAEVEYREHTSPSVYVKFPLSEDSIDGKTFKREILGDEDDARKVSFLIWTTTPWTLPANLGIAVNPNFEYCAIESGDEIYIVACELAEVVAQKCGLGETKIVARFPGSRLDRLEARHAWLERASLLMLGDHVTLGGEADAETELDVKDAREKSATSKAGTGLVHTAPGHGHDDFVIGKSYGLDIYCPVDSAGRFTNDVEQFAQMRVFDANPKIVEFLRERGALLFAEDYAHRYPHCWRCKNPVIFRATPQWFISLDAKATAPAIETVETDDDGRDRSNYIDNEADAPRSLREGALEEIARVRWIPAWGEDRMRNMLKGRPDWCVSRQRVWGVPIPVFYCKACGVEIADAKLINRVADFFERESSDAWYKRDARELLPEDFKCPGCKGAEFTKETDILDVWFDSGSSWVSVFKEYFADELKEWRPADVYLEGGDQYRGWFNSSLMVSLAAHDRAPYRTVSTHGWTLDAQGRAMHKSAGNAVSPDEFVKTSGADILRVWCASSNYQEDMRCSPEILARASDAYRKIRNTARFALGNLDGFDPARDRVAQTELFEIDRWALAELDAVVERALAAYREYDFHAAYQTLYNFCTVALSARYFDIIKDRLYTSAPRAHARRAAQTALYEIADALARLSSPLLVFTADEIWENLPAPSYQVVGGDDATTSESPRAPSVHLASFPLAAGTRDEELSLRWAQIFEVREVALRALEEARATKVIGSSLEARVELKLKDPLYTTMTKYQAELRYVFIVSRVGVVKTDDEASPDISVQVFRAEGQKCERCWNYSERVGEFHRYPTVCERCIEALAEIEAEGAMA